MSIRHSKLVLPALACLLALPLLAADAASETDHESFADALKHGDWGIGLLYRFAHVSDDAFALDATGSKLRTTFGYTSGRYHGLSFELEVEDVANLGAEDRHDNGGVGSLDNGVTNRPVIADPDNTEIQRVNLRYDGIRDTRVTVGRQEFGLGSLRFIGPVAWRLGHGSYDGVRIDQGSIPRTDLTYVPVTRANTPIGARRDMASDWLYADVDAGRFGTVSVYRYDIDFDTAAAQSTVTFGASWVGEGKLGEYAIPFHLEVAQQDDGSDNPTSIDAGYTRLDVGARRGGWTVRAGYEVLEGGADGVLQTPLATLHAFNGWADKFLVTPANGLEDLSLSVGWTRGDVSARLIWHEFSAEAGGPDHGSEIDGVVSYLSGWGQRFGVKFALFDAEPGGGFTDTEKVCFFTSYAF